MSEELSLSESERQSIALLTCADPVQFCKFFLGHLFPLEIGWFHRGLLSILTQKTKFLLKYGELDKIVSNFVYEDSAGEVHQIFRVFVDGTEVRPQTSPEQQSEIPSSAGDFPRIEIKLDLGKFTLIMVPRGFSKTTFAGVAVPLYNILFQTVDFTAYVSHAADHSRMQLDTVKRELSGNNKIHAVFGNVRPKLSDDERWSQDLFETTTGMAMVARGLGSQIRGLNHNGSRPKRIICDDLENRESVATDAQRQKTRVWAYGDLMPALSELEPGATIIALGTMLDKECLLEVWGRDPVWTVVKFGAFDKQGDPLWPLMMDRPKYEAKKKSFALAGMLHVFYMEYENVYRAPELQVFKQEHLLIYIPKDAIVATAIYMDPAISEEVTACRTVIAVASITESGLIRVRECWAKLGAHPREQINQYFSMWKKYQPQKAGIESNAYQKALVYLMKEEMARFGLYFEIEKITNTKNKLERIKGILAPRFSAGYISLDRHMPELESELLDFPAGLMDCPDGTAGAVALLDDYAGVAVDPDRELEMLPPLEKEIGGEWRWAQ